MQLSLLDWIVSSRLHDRGFQQQDDVGLSDYPADAVTVVQDEPIDVILRFTPDAELYELRPRSMLTVHLQWGDPRTDRNSDLAPTVPKGVHGQCRQCGSVR